MFSVYLLLQKCTGARLLGLMPKSLTIYTCFHGLPFLIAGNALGAKLITVSYLSAIAVNKCFSCLMIVAVMYSVTTQQVTSVSQYNNSST